MSSKVYEVNSENDARDEILELGARNKRLGKQLDITLKDSARYVGELNDALAKVDKLRECVEFYAKPMGSRESLNVTHTMYLDDTCTIDDAGWLLKLEGKRARQCLKDLESGNDKQRSQQNH